MSGTKLARVKENLDLGRDGYRGNQNLSWRTGAVVREKDPKTQKEYDRIIEEFAIRCRCGVWWGWASLARSLKIETRIHAKGCPKCKKAAK